LQRLGYDKILDEIKLGSSRAAIILAVASIDDVLRAAISCNFIHLPGREEDQIFSGNGPLSTFSSRIKIAHAMGLISKKVRSDLDVLRKIRNKYAHGTKDIDLSDDDQKKSITNLNALSGIGSDAIISVNELLAKSVEKINLYLILRTAPSSFVADSELISSLSCLDFSNVTEVARKNHQRVYKNRGT